MLDHCPHCQTALRFSAEQAAKLHQALTKLDPGASLKLKCPHCQQAIALKKPEPTMHATPAPSTHKPTAGGDNKNVTSSKSQAVRPPPPPSLDWLEAGRFEGEDKVDDVPMAMLLYPEGSQRGNIAKALEAVGYQLTIAENADHALERMRFVRFSCIALDADAEGGLDASAFHAFMRAMPMERRRYIFYILIGGNLHTLYNLEALAHSANLTVNLEDLRHLDIILRKAIPAYEELFGPMLEELSSYGKR